MVVIVGGCRRRADEAGEQQHKDPRSGEARPSGDAGHVTKTARSSSGVTCRRNAPLTSLVRVRHISAPRPLPRAGDHRRPPRPLPRQLESVQRRPTNSPKLAIRIWPSAPWQRSASNCANVAHPRVNLSARRITRPPPPARTSRCRHCGAPTRLSGGRLEADRGCLERLDLQVERRSGREDLNLRPLVLRFGSIRSIRLLKPNADSTDVHRRPCTRCITGPSPDHA